MLVRLLKQMLVWIYPRYAGSKGQLCNTGEENGYWINGTTAHLTATAKALENFFGPCLPKKRRWSLSCLFSTPFSLPSYPVSIAPSPPILFFFHLSFPSYLLSYSNCPCFSPLFTFQQANSSSGACFARCDSTPCLHFPPSSGSAVPPQCCSPETPTARSSLSSQASVR